MTPLKNEGKYLVELQKKTNQSENGFLLAFESLLEISKKNFQEIDVTIIACKAKESLHRYKEDQEMYETCDIVIEMIDGGFWEVFSKNVKWIGQLAKKFQDVEFLTSDFKHIEPNQNRVEFKILWNTIPASTSIKDFSKIEQANP